MYQVIFYEDEKGISPLWNQLEAFRTHQNNKDYLIQYKQMLLYIQLLQNNGTYLPNTITKHIEDGIWELRPGMNRILYFFHHNDTFVLLHSFRKKIQKTPRREIEQAKRERNIYLHRKELESHEDLE